jgi:hypothetical protein
MRYLNLSSILLLSALGSTSAIAAGSVGSYYGSNYQVLQQVLDTEYAASPTLSRMMSKNDFNGVVSCSYGYGKLGVRYSSVDFSTAGLPGDFTVEAIKAAKHCTTVLDQHEVPIQNAVHSQ